MDNNIDSIQKLMEEEGYEAVRIKPDGTLQRLPVDKQVDEILKDLVRNCDTVNGAKVGRKHAKNRILDLIRHERDRGLT